MMGRTNPLWIAIFKLAIAAALLGLLFATLDTGDLLARLAGADPFWVGLALLLTVPQTVLSAMRWRWVAWMIDDDIPIGHAVREYYIATWLNQVLPGGIGGEVTRVVRRGMTIRTVRDGAGGWHLAFWGVALERIAGQVFILMLALPALSLLGAGAFWTGCAVFALGCAGVFVLLRRRAPAGRLRLRPLLRLFLSSALIVVSYIVVFWCSVRALGIPLGAWEALILLPPALLAMLLPITPAGWGLREAASAAIWGAAGLAMTDGVAGSILYGVVILIGALPGLPFLMMRSRPAGLSGAARQPVSPDLGPELAPAVSPAQGGPHSAGAVSRPK